MGNKIYTVAIIGTGARGADTYGRLLMKCQDRFKIVALCDLKPERLRRYGEAFGVPADKRFLDENEFFAEKRADLLIIATQDNDHYGHILKAFEKGYHIMVEKPLTASRKECEEILAAQKAAGKQALVCHVLRYAPAFLKAAELIDEGKIGRLVAIDALERVAYWHQAHSYVRGNWRSGRIATPMILAKCCHDLDLLQYYARSACESVSSVGDLTYFTKENAPEGAAERCTACKYVETCPYSAKDIYVEGWKRNGSKADGWPYNVIAPAPVDEAKLQKAIEEGPYGRCVFACDNDVVDHQFTQMTFANGVKASLLMTAFTHGSGRRYAFHGTLGELVLDEETHTLTLGRFGEVDKETIDTQALSDNGYGHGGGDFFLVQNLYDMLEGKATSKTSLTASVESHLMGICAEESRLHGGALVKVHE